MYAYIFNFEKFSTKKIPSPDTPVMYLSREGEEYAYILL